MLALALALLAGGPADGPAAASPVPAAALAGWSEILATRVSSEGLVDYRAIAAKDRPKLDAFLAAIAAAKVPADRDVTIALYADAYNARVIQRVIDEKYPRSVLDVKGFFDSAPFVVAGQKMTLDALEKKLIAPLANPGHHFILVCAAMGCPKLEKKPFLADPAAVGARMTAAARAYLATPRGAAVSSGALQLSKIFEWYAKDFGGPKGALSFALEHLPPAARAQLGASPKVSSLEYDWTLNQP